MFLYSLTLQKPSAINQAVYGNFSAPNAQEIVVGRGKVLELLRPDENGKIQTVLSVDIFGVIRSLVSFRLTGATKDYLIVGSDSGRIVILEYNADKNRFDKVHQETFGKSGCRRIVPGQYLAADPRGRAVMIGSVEKQKLVYILNRDSANHLTISSPLEAHKAHTVIYNIIGVDVGFENPIFATLEMDYEEEPGEGLKKSITYYELDLGLNHVMRKWNEDVDRTANMMIAVPGGSDGPSGVLVCSENYLVYKSPAHPEIRAALPRRKGIPTDQGVLIVASSTHKTKDKFFFLVQSEYGDLYKVTLAYQEDTVNEIRIHYFDSVPVANSLVAMRTGFLFVASDFSNHGFYQLQATGEEEEESMEITGEGEDLWTYFDPHKLKNLALIDEVESLSPVMDFKVADLAREDSPQIYIACGRGKRSTLRALRHGLPVTEMAVSPLPGNPNAVWTVKTNLKESYHKYIVVSFVNATLILGIGETVEEATDSGFIGNTPTLLVGNIGDDGLLQVHPNGIRHIRGDKRIHEWKTPGKKTIVHAAANERQVVIALSGGDILYFELDALGQLLEVDKKFMGREVACLDVGQIPEGRQRARFLAVGDWDNTVRILSLDPEDCLQSLSIQALPTHPESLCISEMTDAVTKTGNMFLSIGLNNGVLLRSMIDPMSGELSDTRTRFLGAKGVKLFKIKLKGTSAVLAVSSRSWLCYNHQGKYLMTPLSYVPLEYAANFSSEPVPEGIVAISTNTLRIIILEKLGGMFNQSDPIPLLHTPRKFVIHPQANLLVVLETDHNSASLAETAQYQWGNGEAKIDAKFATGVIAPAEGEEVISGEARPGPGRWASCIRLVDPVESRTLDLLEITGNEAAFSICTCVFHDKGGEVFVVVGTGYNVMWYPNRTSHGGFIHVYRVTETNQLQYLHKTPVEGIPYSLCPFQGRLLAGIGNTLRIYDLGRAKLLRKCENKSFPNFITNIHTQGDRIYVGDIQESTHFVKYKKSDNQLYIFADEPVPRWLTTNVVLDYDTVAGADKFGNIFISRLPSQVSDEVEEDPTGSSLKIERGYLNGAPHKLETLSAFHVGETISSLQRTTLAPGGTEALVYTTLLGTIGAITPFTSREDVDFFSHLEMYLRQENPPLCGRDHLAYRSAFFPVKQVIDGDLCEQFANLDLDKQKSIAEELDRTPSEVLKKLEDIRNKLL